MATARKHHFVSRFYLKNFLDPALDGQLNVLDVRTGRWFSTQPANIGAKRDFNRVERENLPIDALENAIAQFECGTSAAMNRLVASREYPNPDDLNWILNLVGLYAVRNPSFRAAYNSARNAEIRTIGNMLVSDEKLFESQLRSAQEAGYVSATDVSFDEMRRFIESEEYDIEIPSNENHDVEFKAFDKILPILGERYWTLLVVNDDCFNIISCDHPVIITYKEPSARPVGLGTKNTELIFPLSPEFLLYGVYEDPLKEVVELSQSKISAFNTRIAANADRHIFSSKGHFLMRRNGEVVQCTNAA